MLSPKFYILKFLLPAFLVSGCSEKDVDPDNHSFLKTDIQGKEQEISRFSGTLISEGFSKRGEANLAVKLKSEKGETIEILIFNYEKNKVYPLLEEPRTNNLQNGHGASGSSRLCITGPFFFDSPLQDSKPLLIHELKPYFFTYY